MAEVSGAYPARCGVALTTRHTPISNDWVTPFSGRASSFRLTSSVGPRTQPGRKELRGSGQLCLELWLACSRLFGESCLLFHIG